MKTLKTEKGYKLKFNGSSTYFVISQNELGEKTIFGRTDTLRKANNLFKRILSSHL